MDLQGAAPASLALLHDDVEGSRRFDGDTLGDRFAVPERARPFEDDERLAAYAEIDLAAMRTVVRGLTDNTLAPLYRTDDPDEGLDFS